MFKKKEKPVRGGHIYTCFRLPSILKYNCFFWVRQKNKTTTHSPEAEKKRKTTFKKIFKQTKQTPWPSFFFLSFFPSPLCKNEKEKNKTREQLCCSGNPLKGHGLLRRPSFFFLAVFIDKFFCSFVCREVIPSVGSYSRRDLCASIKSLSFLFLFPIFVCGDDIMNG